MAIPELQLKTWANQGATTTAKSTADSVKNALNSYSNWLSGVNFEVYLQGSYKNNTNIRGDSDVDVVAQLNSTFYYNLSEDQRRSLGITLASYSWPDFRASILQALKSYYGQSQIVEGNKSIKIRANGRRLSADVVACCQYRKYKTVNSCDYVEGMCFWTKNENRQVINYPRDHYDNGLSKHQNSGKWYKPVVRLFKNSRSNIPGDATPSYFLECMLHNVPNSNFGTSYSDTFCDVVNWLDNNSLDNFVCQNGQLNLFDPFELVPEQWNTDEAENFIKNLISLWNNW